MFAKGEIRFSRIKEILRSNHFTIKRSPYPSVLQLGAIQERLGGIEIEIPLVTLATTSEISQSTHGLATVATTRTGPLS